MAFSRYVNTYRQMKQEGFSKGFYYLGADYQKLYATIIK